MMETRSSRSLLLYEASPGGQFHKEIGYIIFNTKCGLNDVSVVLKIFKGSDHHLLRAMFRFPSQGEKLEKRCRRTTIKWDLYTSFAAFGKIPLRREDYGGVAFYPRPLNRGVANVCVSTIS
ncbi:unnamed protein product [Heligmosomoides polygyrus]|uniref:Uncharacterized protein n=1 Tax=Heligmosomoides polygyrus TaxID=6339 RepID=A0A183F1Z0_HELPZ|nr:unnamed protein product [Heligmosomoides polygyrus]